MSAITFRICPSCSSGKIDVEGDIVSDLSAASCQACGWSGKVSELMLTAADDTKFEGLELSGDTALKIAQDVSKQYMVLLAKHAGQAVGLAMVEAGVVGQQDPKSLGRLIRAACQGAHKATLVEVEAMQKEIQDERRTSGN
jgi:hypothetical protein